MKKENKEIVYDVDFLKEKEYNKILKANSIIRGKVAEDTKLKINIYDMRVLNFLLKTLQECIRKDGEPKEFTTLMIPMEIFKRVVDHRQNWRANFIKTIKKLENIAFDLNNYRDWKKSQFIIWQRTRLVINPKFILEDKERINAICKISFPYELAVACWQKTDYTHLNFKIINNFKSKYALRIYEVLISKIQYRVNQHDYKCEYDLTKNELEDIFQEDLSANNIKNGFKNWLTTRIRIQETVEEIQKYLNVSYEIHSKDRIITFKISREELEKYRTKKDDMVDLALEKFRNIIDTKLIEENDNQRVYELDKEKPEDAMMQFIGNLANFYANKSLLQQKNEIEIFGDVAINEEGQFYYKQTKKIISYGKIKKFLIYLYKNHYERIINEIREIKKYKQNYQRNLFD